MNEIAKVEHSSAAYLDMATASQNLNALKMRHNLMVSAMQEVLKENIDYGKIPGTGDKPTLLKAGAENLSFMFGLRPTFDLVDSIEDWDAGLFYYRYRCTLSGGDGRIVANSEGSCNSRETKYRYRNAKAKCPSCGAESISKSKYPPRDNPNGTPGWYCRDCKAQFAANDPQITGQDNGKVENTEPFELVNTIQKMAQKRALVAAVLIGTGASQFFTQDVEDMTTITIDAEIVTVEPAVTKSVVKRPPQPEDSIGLKNAPDLEDPFGDEPKQETPTHSGLQSLVVDRVGATTTKNGKKCIGLWEPGQQYPSFYWWGGRDALLEKCPWLIDSATKDDLGEVGKTYKFNADVFYVLNENGYKDISTIERIV